ncbi:hypothetical protein [Thermocoleostomius sinensis]|uniref:Uncharacterized protein n=1 Tax=Thermocoleostomius sinensis A174 TaxID=2016057 RepID=A0A9E8ZEX5_9CYAN|nr:hypothetical protein [Thermocoleostomius sinensis]WAL60567.1 hypothetical protein OXH18_00810 [Thermocoleostomius sinensis A174]
MTYRSSVYSRLLTVHYRLVQRRFYAIARQIFLIAKCLHQRIFSIASFQAKSYYVNYSQSPAIDR